MSENNVAKVTTWLKSIGSALVVTAGTFAATAVDDGFGRDRSVKQGVYALSGAIGAIGWLLMATGLTWHPETQIPWRTVAVWVCCAGIAVTTAVAFGYRVGELKVPAVVNVLHAASWLLLGGAVSVIQKGGSAEVDSKNLVLGVGGAVAVVVGTLLLYPWERAACITEGPGQALVLAGWLMFVQTR